ncbi:MAG: acyl-CoA thioesterase/bile acid-CoA:amino acid N-acyltransferase family protein [Proteobacteria bacterium]|nr:acyl-CoA thioesterase/bile acid-CoA:amino acid N-acyltransferase family protein [Pseudomonadota bacterium]MDA1058870.1 acyl-CoA thioesterase/bile acid-CoA:amino acid N-acyltransferase family protein [Pseudomonadota bacterium]
MAYTRATFASLAAAALVTTMTYVSAQAADLVIDILPRSTLVAGDAFAVVIRGGTPGQSVELESRSSDFFNDTWIARNAYIFDSNGTVDPGRQAPFVGSYEGIDGLGPFWSMKRVTERPVPWGFGRSAQQLPQFFFTRAGVNRVTLRASAPGGADAQAAIEFTTVGRGVIQRQIGDPQIVGTFFEPTAPSPWPTVVVLGGNRFTYRGAQTIAGRLATQGYAALALAYADVGDLPPLSSAVALEYFDNAMAWVRRQSNVIPEKIALLGVGHDAGLALLLAANAPNAFAAVVAANPHSVVFPRQTQSGAPWTRSGGQLPHVPLAHWDDDFRRTGHYYYVLEKSLVLFEDAVAAARIPVERITSPVLLLSAGDDLAQPSDRMAREIAQAMGDAGHRDRARHLKFLNAGLVLSGDGITPTTPSALRFGGTPQGNSAAQFKAWQEVLTFLRQSLR